MNKVNNLQFRSLHHRSNTRYLRRLLDDEDIRNISGQRRAELLCAPHQILQYRLLAQNVHMRPRRRPIACCTGDQHDNLHLSISIGRQEGFQINCFSMSLVFDRVWTLHREESNSIGKPSQKQSIIKFLFLKCIQKENTSNYRSRKLEGRGQEKRHLES